MIVIGKTFGVLPSRLLREYLAPDEDLLNVVTPLDWYVFDVTAAAVYGAMMQDERDETEDEIERKRAGKPPRRPTSRRRRGPTVRESGEQGLTIRGTEIPPWDPRHPRYDEYRAGTGKRA